MARDKLHIGLMNLVYNLKRLEQITRLGLKPYEIDAPAVV